MLFYYLFCLHLFLNWQYQNLLSWLFVILDAVHNPSYLGTQFTMIKNVNHRTLTLCGPQKFVSWYALTICIDGFNNSVFQVILIDHRELGSQIS